MASSDGHLGFLEVVEPKVGVFVGGLLVTGVRGRPLEFQCTTPVVPNATQKTLYGPTLRPFVVGELIGKTLYDKVGVKPKLLLVSDADVLDVRTQVPCPVARVVTGDSRDIDLSDETLLEIGGTHLAFHRQFSPDRDKVEEIRFDEYLDLSEPLERVRDALRQTVKAEAA